jgi:long-subunit fatty acid transport protein
MKHNVSTLLVVLLFFVSSASADIDHMYGFGSTTAASAGSNKARSYDAYTIQLNPALMSFSPGGQVSTGFLGAVDHFEKLQNVVIDNTYVGGSSVRSGDVETNVPDTFTFLIGTVTALSENEKAWRFGIGLGFPGDKLMEPTTKDIYQPEYAMYMSDTQRFAANFALSRKFGEHVAVGLGLSYHLMTGATVLGRLPQDGGAGNPKTTTGDLKMVVRPTFSPLFGFVVQPDENHSIAFNYKGARDARVATKFDSTIELVGTAPLIFSADGSIFYDPETYTGAYSFRSGRWDMNAALDYERWEPFDGAVVHFKFDTFTNSFKQYQFHTRYHDIWVPHVGLTFRPIDTEMWHLGYAYKPSPTPSLQGESNFLDSDRHIVGLGYDFQTGTFGMLDTPVKWSTHLQCHYLIPRSVKKDDPTYIGAPGYEVKGYVISYGLNLTVEL